MKVLKITYAESKVKSTEQEIYYNITEVNTFTVENQSIYLDGMRGHSFPPFITCKDKVAAKELLKKIIDHFVINDKNYLEINSL